MWTNEEDEKPTGQVLVQYLTPFFGEWSVDVTTGYYDSPDDYEDNEDGTNDANGWLAWDNDIPIRVIAWMPLPKTTFKMKDNQKEFLEKYTNDPLRTVPIEATEQE